MKILRRSFFLVAALAAISILQTNVSAGDLGYGYHALGYGYGLNSSAYATDRIPTPPYFSIHPPVYYSAPVPRTYGYSPYAYDGSVRTPDIEMKMNVSVMENPYYKGKTEKVKAKTAGKKTTQKVVFNPFVGSEHKTTLASINE